MLGCAMRDLFMLESAKLLIDKGAGSTMGSPADDSLSLRVGVLFSFHC